MEIKNIDQQAPAILSATRDYALDNLRFFLIFSVVFAHLLEVCNPFPGSRQIYQLIYTFHMPAFIFLFGYNAKYAPARIVYRWCIPYIVFQSLYLLFAKAVLGAAIKFQYITPYWLLWYMLACIFYQLLLPLYDTTGPSRQLLALLCTFILSLLIGFLDFVGYGMSLSRFFVFQPWFLLGYYCKKNNIPALRSVRSGTRFVITLISAGIIVSCAPYCIQLPTGLLYGSYSYSRCGGTLLMRLVVALVSFSWILLLFVGIKPCLNKRLPLLTGIGQNTWPVFLLHGFLVRAIPVYWPVLISAPWKVLLITGVILGLLGNKAANTAIRCIGFSWLEWFTSSDHHSKKLRPDGSGTPSSAS